MPQTFVNDNGTLRNIREVYVNDNGTLRNIREVYVNDNGTLRLVFTRFINRLEWDELSNIFFTSDIGSGPVTAFLTSNSNGQATRDDGQFGATAVGGWHEAEPSAPDAELYQVRVTNVSSAVDGGSDPTGVWLDCDTIRNWFWSRNVATTITGQWQYRVKADPAATVETRDFQIQFIDLTP